MRHQRDPTRARLLTGFSITGRAAGGARPFSFVNPADSPAPPVIDDEVTGLAPSLAGTDPLATLDALLADRARALGPATVLLELGADGEPTAELTFQQLQAEAQALARRLEPLPPDQPLVLLSVQGAREFLVGFFAILLAGGIAVPAYPPVGHRQSARTAAILLTGGFGGILTQRDLLPRFAPLAPAGLARLSIDASGPTGPSANRRPRMPSGAPTPWAPALLQFTSGSTADPRGVRLAHRNLLSNLGACRRRMAFPFAGNQTLVSWLPPYHDMGLILNFLYAVYLGARLVWMPPARFLRQPLSWLQAISEHGGCFSAAPNFAYDLCVEAAAGRPLPPLDLRGWQVALSGAEPIRPRTLRRFAACFAPAGLRPTALRSGYGLAEASLAVTGSPPATGPRLLDVSASALRDGRVRTPVNMTDTRTLASSGPVLDGLQARIVPPGGVTPQRDREIGEILVAGPSVGEGYQDDDGTAEVFGVRVPGEPGAFLRTGDLGFFDGGHLFVTGRLKELIIVHGENHYPQDLEQSAGLAAPELQPDTCCAFAVDDGDHEAVVVVAALRGSPPPDRLAQIAAAVAAALARDHGVQAADVVLVRAGSLPLTTSGKRQRARCRALLLADGLPVLYRKSGDAPASPAAGDPAFARLAALLRQAGGRPGAEIERTTALGALGLDSIQRVRALLAVEDAFGPLPLAEGLPEDLTVDDLLRLLPRRRPVASPAQVDLPLPKLTLPLDPARAERQAAGWRERWTDFESLQSVTELRYDAPVQVLRLALALRRHPAIPLENTVALALRWTELEQFAGWYANVPKVGPWLERPDASVPLLWAQLQAVAAAVSGPAVVTLFHVIGWDWFLALVVRAALGAGRRLAVLHDPDVADVNDLTRRRLENLAGASRAALEADGRLVLVDIRHRSFAATMLRLLAEERWVLALPDAVHHRRARPGTVDVPLLGGSIRLATGVYQIAAERSLPLLHLAFQLTPDGPRLDTVLQRAPPLPADDPAALGAAIARLLAPFLAILEAQPEQWRQWRLLVPAPAAPPGPGNGALLDPRRLLHLQNGYRHWLMCAASQRTVMVPEPVFQLISVARDCDDLRQRLHDERMPSVPDGDLIGLLAGEDPHRLFL